MAIVQSTDHSGPKKSTHHLMTCLCRKPLLILGLACVLLASEIVPGECLSLSELLQPISGISIGQIVRVFPDDSALIVARLSIFATSAPLILPGNDSSQVPGGSQWSVLVARIAKDGDIIWVAREMSGFGETPSDACIDEKGNVYVVGSTNGGFNASKPGAMVFKYSSSGQRMWMKTFGSGYDKFEAVQAAGSNLIIAGTVSAYSDIFLGEAKSRDKAYIPVIVSLDATTGQGKGPVLRVTVPDKRNSAEVSKVSMAVNQDGSIAYVVTKASELVQEDDEHNTTYYVSRVILYRVNLSNGQVISTVLPGFDCNNVHVHVPTSLDDKKQPAIFVALDRHGVTIPSLTKAVDSVDIFRLDAATLQNSDWATGLNSDITVAESVSVPIARRQISEWTVLQGLGFSAKHSTLSLLLQTPEESFSKTRNMSVELEASMVAPSNITNVHPAVLFIDASGNISAVSTPSPTSVGAITLSPSSSLQESRREVNGMEYSTDGKSILLIGTDFPINVSQPQRQSLFLTRVEAPSHSGNGGTSSANTGSDRSNDCIGASSRVGSQYIADLITSNSLLRRQQHPLARLPCAWQAAVSRIVSGDQKFSCREDKQLGVEMLCHSSTSNCRADGTRCTNSRLCATADHIIYLDGHPTYMCDFCKRGHSCTVEYDEPVNFKGPCGQHIPFSDFLSVTQHIGDKQKESARDATARECEERQNYPIRWLLATL